MVSLYFGCGRLKDEEAGSTLHLLGLLIRCFHIG